VSILSPNRDVPGVMVDPLSPEAEPIRVLRTGVRFAGVGRPLRTILISSDRPDTGKSTIAANLAVSFANVGERVLLVDADLRRPSQSDIFRVNSPTGLSTMLVEGGNLIDHVVSGTHQGLDLLPSGPLPPNPSELLSGQHVQSAVAQMAIEYETVIIDSPPTLMAAEAAILASLVDGVIFVVDLKRSRRRDVFAALDLLDRAGARVIGSCVNRYGRVQRATAYY